MDSLPSDIKHAIYTLVNESGAQNLSKVSKEFRKIGKNVVTESMESGLQYYKRKGKHYDQAVIAATLTSETKSLRHLRKLLRVSLTAYKEHRLIESFLRWKDDGTVTFYSELMGLRYRYKDGYTEKTKKPLRAIFSASVRQHDIKELKKRDYYKPLMLIDFIVQYVYDQAVERSFQKLQIS